MCSKEDIVWRNIVKTCLTQTFLIEMLIAVIVIIIKNKVFNVPRKKTKKDTLGRQYIQYRNRTSKFQQRIQAFTFRQTSSSHRKTCGELFLGGKQLRLQVGQD
jgi:hypothetical protein